MHAFHRPPVSEVRRLLEAAGLPSSDLTPRHLEHFLACGAEERADGIVGLELYGKDALLRSLVVEERARRRGLGKALVTEAERHAKARGVQRLYLLTTSAAKFFEALGYARAARESAPASIRATAEFATLCAASAELMSKALVPAA